MDGKHVLCQPLFFSWVGNGQELVNLGDYVVSEKKENAVNIHLRYAAFAIVCMLGLAGCGEEVQTYTVANTPEAPSPADADAPPGGMGMGMGSGMGMGMAPSAIPTDRPVQWSSPEEWQELPAGGMRLASYKFEGDSGAADISVIALSGDGGGLVQNINRWRGQVGLPPASAEEIQADIENIPVTGGTVTFAELRGPEGGNGILGGLLEYGGQTWFFKMTAPDSLITKQKETFRKWLESVEVSETTE